MKKAINHELRTIRIALPSYSVDLIDDVVDRDMRGWLVAWAVHTYVESEGRGNVRRLAAAARHREDELFEMWDRLGEYFKQPR